MFVKPLVEVVIRLWSPLHVLGNCAPLLRETNSKLGDTEFRTPRVVLYTKFTKNSPLISYNPGCILLCCLSGIFQWDHHLLCCPLNIVAFAFSEQPGVEYARS